MRASIVTITSTLPYSVDLISKPYGKFANKPACVCAPNGEIKHKQKTEQISYFFGLEEIRFGAVFYMLFANLYGFLPCFLPIHCSSSPPQIGNMLRPAHKESRLVY